MILVDSSPVLIGSLITTTVGLIVVYDLLHLYKNKKTVPKLGNLPLGGFAWSSTIEQEIFRNGPNILTLITMAILPWLLASPTLTPTWIVIIFDILLILLVITMLLPKRYAITKTSIYADGQRLGWESIKELDPEVSISRRIVLHREGWWIFAPLPLGGSKEELSVARELIIKAQSNDWPVIINEEEE